MDAAEKTQKDPAEALNTHQSYVSLIISGERPGTKHLATIARVCGVSVAYLKTGVSDDKPPLNEKRERRSRLLALTSREIKHLARNADRVIELAPSAAEKAAAEALGKDNIAFTKREDRAFLVFTRKRPRLKPLHRR